VGGFFQQLAKTLADRWISLLVLPGAFFLGAVWLSVSLGHGDAWNVALLTRRVENGAARVADLPSGAQALLVVAVLVAAAGTGFVVQALAAVTRRVWLGPWPRPFAPLAAAGTVRRRARWHRLVEERRALEAASPVTRTREQQDRIDAVAHRITRLAMAEPGRPTWMGDRIHAVESIAYHRYGLDLTYGWSRLWLVLPDPARTELTAAHSARRAGRRGHRPDRVGSRPRRRGRFHHPDRGRPRPARPYAGCRAGGRRPHRGGWSAHDQRG
jgi:hypothetical protein